jgi:cytidylate kinase
MNKGFAVAIDGPVASGKGTIASALARKLSGSFINTGAMYRCVALLCLERGINTGDEPLVNNILPEVNVVFNKEQVLLDGKDITERIKEPDIAALAALVASYAGVRKDLVVKQQKIANDEKKKGNIVIMEGRDIGTRVMPDADLKIFLTADSNIRARRRLEQFAQKGIE